jgi:hypothetical protein
LIFRIIYGDHSNALCQNDETDRKLWEAFVELFFGEKSEKVWFIR